MFYGLLSRTGTLRYSSAGHEPPVCVSGRGVEAMDAGGLVLGLFADVAYESGCVTLEPGDLVVVCRDGVTEARNAADEEFWRERFVASIREAHGLEPPVVLQQVLDAVREFTAGAPQADDMTIVVLRYRR